MRWLWLAGFVVVGCDDGGGDGAGEDCPEVSSSISVEFDGMLPGEAPAGSEQSFRVRLVSVCGEPLTEGPGITVNAGAAATSAQEDGWQQVTWTLAPVPVRQTLSVQFGPVNQDFTIDATLADPLPETTVYAGITELLMAEGIEGSTEDLAVTTERITLPAPGGLVHVAPDGTPTWQAVDDLLNPLGIAAAADGGWWIVDSEAATLWRVEADGTAIAHLNAEEPGLLQSPNHLAVGPDDKIYLSDPCAGSLLRYDPATGAVDARVDFDPATDGGPNGVAFDPSGQLHIMTGNAILQCQQIGLAPPDAELARVWRIPVDEVGFGMPMALTDPVGTFGDGITFDALGNLYFIADAIEGLSLTESAVLVLPVQGGEPRKVAVAPAGVIYANLAFGVGDFGAQTLYISLLSVPPFAGDESRGLHRMDAHIMRGPVWQ